MPGAGIQSLTLALSCLLIICTGTLIGSITITTWNDLLRKARDNGDEGVSQCLNSGELDIKAMSGRFLHAVVGRVAVGFDAFFEAPERPIHVLNEFVQSYHPNVSTSPAFIDKTIRPMWRALFMDAALRHGVQSATYESLPFSPAYPHPVARDLQATGRGPPALSFRSTPWGGSVHFFRANGVSAYLTNDTVIPLVMESRDMRTGAFQHGPIGIVGEASPNGNIWNSQRGCNLFANYSNDQWMGSCVFPYSFTGMLMEDLIDGKLGLSAGNFTYVPAKVGFSGIVLQAFFAMTHPEMINLYPGQKNRVSHAKIELGGQALSEMLRAQELPQGSLIYTVQRNHETGEQGGLLSFNNGTVTGLQMKYVPPPINEMRMVRYMINITNHSDIQGGSIPSAIASHGRYVFSLDGGYDETVELSKDTFHPWTYIPEANATNAVPDEFWTVTKKYTRGSPVTLTWYVTLLVPRSAVMAKIDVSTSSIKAQNEESRQDSEDKQNEALVTMLAATLSAAAVLLAVSVFVTRMIISPLLSLQHDMSCVAVMNLEGVDLESKSRLSEVANMQASFKMMVSNLIEYRNYMPQTVLLSEGDDDDDDADESASEDYKSTRSRSRTSGSSSVGLSKKGSLSSIHVATKQIQQQEYSLRRKSVTVAYFNIKGWHAYCENASYGALTQVHGRVISSLMEAMSPSRGVCDVFSGDRMLVTFNAFKAIGSHRNACVRSAKEACYRMTQDCQKMQLSFACATGVTCGPHGVCRDEEDHCDLLCGVVGDCAGALQQEDGLQWAL